MSWNLGEPPGPPDEGAEIIVFPIKPKKRRSKKPPKRKTESEITKEYVELCLQLSTLSEDVVGDTNTDSLATVVAHQSKQLAKLKATLDEISRENPPPQPTAPHSLQWRPPSSPWRATLSLKAAEPIISIASKSVADTGWGVASQAMPASQEIIPPVRQNDQNRRGNQPSLLEGDYIRVEDLNFAAAPYSATKSAVRYDTARRGLSNSAKLNIALIPVFILLFGVAFGFQTELRILGLLGYWDTYKSLAAGGLSGIVFWWVICLWDWCKPVPAPAPAASNAYGKYAIADFVEPETFGNAALGGGHDINLGISSHRRSFAPRFED